MNQRIVHLALVVNDYDEAIDFYTKKLGFELIEDTAMDEAKRWVLVKPKGEGQCQLLLVKAANPEQARVVGSQTGGRVFLFLHTDDFWRDYNNLVKNKVKFIREPLEQPHGTVAVFQDLYGNLWDLIQPKEN